MAVPGPAGVWTVPVASERHDVSRSRIRGPCSERVGVPPDETATIGITSEVNAPGGGGCPAWFPYLLDVSIVRCTAGRSSVTG